MTPSDKVLGRILSLVPFQAPLLVSLKLQSSNFQLTCPASNYVLWFVPKQTSGSQRGG